MPKMTRRRNPPIPGLGSRVELIMRTRSQDPRKPLSSGALAAVLKVPVSSVKAWRYENKITAADALDLARWAGCSLDWLLGLSDEDDTSGRGERGIEDPLSPDAGRGSDIAEADADLSRALAMIGKAVGAAVRRIVEKDLVENTTKARQSLADSLFKFALELQRGGVDATELLDVVQQIRDGRLLS